MELYYHYSYQRQSCVAVCLLTITKAMSCNLKLEYTDLLGCTFWFKLQAAPFGLSLESTESSHHLYSCLSK